MLIGVQGGFGDPIAAFGADILPTLKRFGVDGVRIDTQDPLDDGRRVTPTYRAALIREVTDAGLIPMVIVRDATQMDGIPPGTHIEIRSEPDIWQPPITPHDYRLKIEAAYKEASYRGLTLWAGTVSNFNERGLGYLEALRPHEWPSDLPVSIHWYPDSNSPNDPHPGFKSRDAEVAHFKSLIGERSWGVSEMGYHTARWWNFCGWFTDALEQHVAQATAFEWRFWARHGAAFAVVYQLSDGLSNQPLDKFGIRRTDGTYKPVAATVAAFKQETA